VYKSRSLVHVCNVLVGKNVLNREKGKAMRAQALFNYDVKIVYSPLLMGHLARMQALIERGLSFSFINCLTCFCHYVLKLDKFNPVLFFAG